MAVRFTCDWCGQDKDRELVSRVAVSNLYNAEQVLHICHGCGAEHMPERLRGVLSWTAP